MNSRLDLNKPRTFNEKLQWLKLYNRKSEYTTMVDKFSVKEYVSKIIGNEYIIPTIAVYDKPEDIDFNILPDKFVLKTTHGGGGCGIIICKEKSSFNINSAINELNKSLKLNLYYNFREWPYKNIHKKILVEHLIVDDSNVDDLKDYKFFCFNGKPYCLKIDYNRFIDHHANYYDMNLNILPFGEACCPPDLTQNIEKPMNFDKMVDIVEKLSKNIPFARIDLYNVQGKIYFGEITFFPASGLGKFIPEEWDYKLGELISLPL